MNKMAHIILIFLFFLGHILLFNMVNAVGVLVRMDEKSYVCRILVEKFLRKMCFEE